MKVRLTLGVTPEGSDNKIGSIKDLRNATGLGLKEAKDLFEEAHDTPVCVKVNPEQFAALTVTKAENERLDFWSVSIEPADDRRDLSANTPYI